MRKILFVFALLTSLLVLVSCSNEPNRAPSITGNVEDDIMILGDSFNIVLGVHASDLEDLDITENVIIEISPNIEVVDGEITPTSTGIYTLTYTVTDSDGATTEVTGILTVTEVLFSLSSSRNGDYVILENGLYMDSIGVAGRWTYVNSIFTLISDNGTEVVGTFNAETNALEVSMQTGWSRTTFSVDEATWQAKLGTTGSYEIPVYN